MRTMEKRAFAAFLVSSALRGEGASHVGKQKLYYIIICQPHTQANKPGKLARPRLSPVNLTLRQTSLRVMHRN